MVYKIKIEDIIFWLLIISIIAIVFWLLSGSPPEIDALITITLTIALSEVLLWKVIFSMDKKTSIGFLRVKHQFDKIEKEVGKIKTNILNTKTEINDGFNELKILIKRGK